MTREELGKLAEENAKIFREQLDGMGKLLKKNQKEDMVAGFKDGFRSAAKAFFDAGHLDIKDP